MKDADYIVKIVKPEYVARVYSTDQYGKIKDALDEKTFGSKRLAEDWLNSIGWHYDERLMRRTLKGASYQGADVFYREESLGELFFDEGEPFQEAMRYLFERFEEDLVR